MLSTRKYGSMSSSCSRIPTKIPADQDWTTASTPFLERLPSCKVEPSLPQSPGTNVQFERVGYFVPTRFGADKLVFNRTVTLKDAWAKIEKSHTPR